MSILQELIRRIQALPSSQRRQLGRKLREMERTERSGGTVARRPGRDLLGALSYVTTKPTKREIEEARSELWGGFPREITT